MPPTTSVLRNAIEQALVAGDFAPGDRLDEMALAVRFGVSRTPVREALTALESTGLVEIKPRRGAFVKALSAVDLLAMFETMAELEASCASFAAQRIDAAQEAALHAALAVCEAAADDPDAYYDANSDFHAVIYRSAGNHFLSAQTSALHLRLQPFRRLQLRVRGRVDQSIIEHRDIVSAVLDGDAQAAARRARDHVAVQGDRFMALLNSVDALGAA
ncbi:MAG: GntR family transcriptional regulator [Pseudomonadota bacterium]